MLVLWSRGGGSSATAKQFKIKKGEPSRAHDHGGAAERGLASRTLRRPSSKASRLLRMPSRHFAPPRGEQTDHSVNQRNQVCFWCVCVHCVVAWHPCCLTPHRPQNLAAAAQPRASCCTLASPHAIPHHRHHHRPNPPPCEIKNKVIFAPV